MLESIQHVAPFTRPGVLTFDSRPDFPERQPAVRSVALLLYIQFGAHGVDFGLHGEVLLLLARQVVARELQLCTNAFRRQQVGVFRLVPGAQKIARLDVALFEQRLQQIVDLAQADTESLGQLSLADGRLGVDDLEDAQLGLFCRGHGWRSMGERE